MKLTIWIKETRPQFLILSVVLVLLGTSVAFKYGYFNWIKFFLTTAGLLLAHISVNVLNDYFDYKSGIDKNTIPTAFSGGSGMLVKGLLKPADVYLFGLMTLVTGLFIGVYLTLISGWQLIVIIIIGGFAIYFYTSFLTKWLIGELWAGLGLGTLPVIGTFFVQTRFLNLEILIVSLIPGLLTANLLFLNEFPDFEADRKGGRYHLVIALGRRKATFLYAGIMFLAYLCVILGVLLKIMPLQALFVIVTLVFALKSIIITFRNYDNIERLIPALKFNVITILGADFLLAFSYFIS
jgi:1,4-dihydroxy-2-naphthoate octaprenyltransferase